MTATLPLGRDVAYPQRYDPSLLYPIPRATGREALGLAGTALPFVGHDRWHAYELGWLDARGKPVVATATLVVPADSPCLVESKSLKLYLNSLNAERFDAPAQARMRIATDLSAVAGAPVAVDFGLPPFDDAGLEGYCLDDLELDIGGYGPPDATQLALVPGDEVVDEVLRSRLLKSNCPVTGQPDWASLHVAYRGPRIDPAGLLRYIVSYREHAGFHEQCVEQIFVDVLARCQPTALSVEARYTRRGGLDINPVRTTPSWPARPTRRDERQ